MTDFNHFSALDLPEPILRAVSEMGYLEPTPIQKQAIPALLEQKNVLGEAQTGTGKTAAFGLPALANIEIKLKKAQLLVVAPTRELAIQVAEQIELMGQYLRGLRVATIYGGSAYGPQIKLLRDGAQIVVGTPGRLMDHLRKGTLQLDALKVAVLDEADEMLNMGFLEDIEWIMDQVPDSAQRCLFSATMPGPIKKIADRFLSESYHIKIASTKENKANIEQKAWRVEGMRKEVGLERILETSDYELVLVFVRTRQDTLTLTTYLREQGFAASGLNGDMSQEQRETTVNELKSGKVRILVATDVVARGLDVQGVTHVINYDLPQDTESYVHRIGRTGRAGRSGVAITFVRPREMHMLRRYERATKGSISLIEVPRGRELTKHRIEQAQKDLLSVIEQQNLETMHSLVQQIMDGAERSLEDIAAALLYEFQKNRPLIVKETPAPKRARENFAEQRGRRGERPNRNERRQGRNRRERLNIEFDTYRLAVGRQHGARPGDLVGAIANEGNLDSKYIGQIQLFDQHATVELPKGLPVEVLRKLQRARVRQQPISITKV